MANEKLLKSLRSIHRHFITLNDDMKALFINSVLNDIDSIIEALLDGREDHYNPQGTLHRGQGQHNNRFNLH